MYVSLLFVYLINLTERRALGIASFLVSRYQEATRALLKHFPDTTTLSQFCYPAALYLSDIALKTTSHATLPQVVWQGQSPQVRGITLLQ